MEKAERAVARQILESSERVEHQIEDLADIDDTIQATMDDPRVKQAIIVLVGDDDEVVRFKGHWYDNAKLMNILIKTYKKRIFNDIFDDSPD